jgi:hypothetical protein
MNRIFDRIAVEPPNVTQDCKARAVRAPHVPHAPAASPRRAPFRSALPQVAGQSAGESWRGLPAASHILIITGRRGRIHKPRPGPALLRAVLGPRTVRASRLEKAEHAMQQAAKSSRASQSSPRATCAAGTCRQPHQQHHRGRRVRIHVTRSRLAARASQCGPGWCPASDRVQAHWLSVTEAAHGASRAGRGIKYGLTVIRAGPGPGHRRRDRPQNFSALLGRDDPSETPTAWASAVAPGVNRTGSKKNQVQIEASRP